MAPQGKDDGKHRQIQQQVGGQDGPKGPRHRRRGHAGEAPQQIDPHRKEGAEEAEHHRQHQQGGGLGREDPPVGQRYRQQVFVGVLPFLPGDAVAPGEGQHHRKEILDVLLLNQADVKGKIPHRIVLGGGVKEDQQHREGHHHHPGPDHRIPFHLEQFCPNTDQHPSHLVHRL